MFSVETTSLNTIEVARLDRFGKLSQGRLIDFFTHTVRLLDMILKSLPLGRSEQAKLILAWHLGRRSAHDARLFARNCACHAFCRQNDSHGFSSLHFP